MCQTLFSPHSNWQFNKDGNTYQQIKAPDWVQHATTQLCFPTHSGQRNRSDQRSQDSSRSLERDHFYSFLISSTWWISTCIPSIPITVNSKISFLLFHTQLPCFLQILRLERQGQMQTWRSISVICSSWLTETPLPSLVQPSAAVFWTQFTHTFAYTNTYLYVYTSTLSHAHVQDKMNVLRSVSVTHEHCWHAYADLAWSTEVPAASTATVPSIQSKRWARTADSVDE